MALFYECLQTEDACRWAFGCGFTCAVQSAATLTDALSMHFNGDGWAQHPRAHLSLSPASGSGTPCHNSISWFGEFVELVQLALQSFSIWEARLIFSNQGR